MHLPGLPAKAIFISNNVCSEHFQDTKLSLADTTDYDSLAHAYFISNITSLPGSFQGLGKTVEVIALILAHLDNVNERGQPVTLNAEGKHTFHKVTSDHLVFIIKPVDAKVGKGMHSAPL